QKATAHNLWKGGRKKRDPEIIDSHLFFHNSWKKGKGLQWSVVQILIPQAYGKRNPLLSIGVGDFQGFPKTYDYGLGFLSS
ncbi:MAG: hypothetical protein ACO3SL_08710, partial [Vulcanococcus sp.]